MTEDLGGIPGSRPTGQAPSGLDASRIDPGRECPECSGEGWTVGIATEARCCGRSEYECGGRGCTGPEPEQVQIQEQCEYCLGSGTVEIGGEEVPPFEGEAA